MLLKTQHRLKNKKLKGINLLFGENLVEEEIVDIPMESGCLFSL